MNFRARMNHEIRNPLAIIIGQFSLYKGEVPAKLEKSIKDACFRIEAFLVREDNRSVKKLKGPTFPCADFDFEYTVEAQYLNTNDFDVLVHVFHKDGRIERLDTFYKGTEISEVLKHGDSWEQIEETANEKLAEILKEAAA